MRRMLEIYTQVKAAGRPNYKGDRVRLPTNLHMSMWEKAIQSHGDHQL